MALKTNLPDLTAARERFRKSIQLLSHGYSAPDIFKDGSVNIFPWTTETSEWFVEQSRKLSGLMLTRATLARLMGLREADVDRMVASEAMLVLLVSRALATQHKILYTCVCPHCGHEQPKESITVPDQLEKVGEKTAEYKGFDEVTLPESADVVRIRPLLLGDELKIEGRSKQDRVKCTDGVARTLTAIVSVGGGTPDSLDELLQYYRALTPTDAEFLEDQIDFLSPHLNTRVRHKCEKCTREFDHDLGLDAAFFRSVRR